MLTGFDSQWVNALFLDKMLQYEGLIQAFSRTNRLLDDDKISEGFAITENLSRWTTEWQKQ